MRKLFNRVKAIFTMDRRTMLLVIEATYFMSVTRLRLLLFSFAKLAPSLGDYMKETSNEYRGEDHRIISTIRQTIDIVDRNTFWETKCLVRAITALRMLERRGISSTLYLGTARDESGKMIAHAWLRSGTIYVTGSEGMERFTTTGTFAKIVY